MREAVRCVQQGMSFRVEFARKEALGVVGEQIDVQVSGSVNDFVNGRGDRINSGDDRKEAAGQATDGSLQGQVPVIDAKVSGTVNDRINGRGEHVNEHVNESEFNVFREIQIDPEITYKRLAATLGVSISTVRRRALALKGKGIIRRVGSGKTGHWQILKPYDGEFPDGER